VARTSEPRPRRRRDKGGADNLAPAGKNPTAGAVANPDFHWKNVQGAEATGPVALDHSLAFHRLQEARQELYRVCAGFPALSSLQRERLKAHCLANLARAEVWVARTLGPETMISPPPPPQKTSPPQPSSDER
jgi:hypothetical protein